MSEEEKNAIKELIDSNNLSLIGDGTCITLNKTIQIILNLIEKMQKENGQIRTELDRKNKMLEEVKKAITYDRMEQLDDYVIYLQTKYLEILGENEEC